MRQRENTGQRTGSITKDQLSISSDFPLLLLWRLGLYWYTFALRIEYGPLRHWHPGWLYDGFHHYAIWYPCRFIYWLSLRIDFPIKKS